MSSSIKYQRVHLPDLVGKGYGTFWRFKGRYRVVKGSRRSKKSKTMALDAIYEMMEHPQANLLVVRKTYRTLKDSCFTVIISADSQRKFGRTVLPLRTFKNRLKCYDPCGIVHNLSFLSN